MSAVMNESPLLIDMLDAAGPEHHTPARIAPRGVAQLPPESPMGSAVAFILAGGSPEQLDKMMDLQDRWDQKQARKAYVEAMTEFKKTAIVIRKDKHVAFKTDKGITEYNHATLGNVVETTIRALAEFGISHAWDPKRVADRVVVTCTLTHRMGHSESVTLEAPLDTSGGKNNIQAMGSAVSYLERYTLLAITGLSTKEMDDDGRGAGAGDGTQPFDIGGQGDPLRERPPAPTTYDAAMFAANLPQWREVIGAGRKTPDALIEFIEKRNLPLTADQRQTLRAIRQA